MTQVLRRHAEDHRPPGTVNSISDYASHEPSWFLHHANQASREELVSRYRKAFNLPDRPPQPARTSSTARYRDLIGTAPRPPMRFLEVHETVFEPREPELKAPERSRGKVLHNYAIAGLVALLAGTTVGVVVSEYGTLKRQAASLYAEYSPTAPAPSATAPLKAVQAASVAEKPVYTSKKPISMATLQVADAAGETNRFIPLMLRAEEPSGAELLLKISGLPPTAYFSSGQRGADNAWAIETKDLPTLKLMVPEANETHLTLAVAAFEKKTGDLAAPIKSLTVALTNAIVEPASAPPPTQAQATKPSSLPGAGKENQVAAIPEPQSVNVSLSSPDDQAVSKLAHTGDGLLKRGDVEGARNAYQQAWEGGAAEGAFGLARSYDPVVIAALKLEKAAPDSKLALLWYTRAADAGLPQASSAIVRLQMKR